MHNVDDWKNFLVLPYKPVTIVCKYVSISVIILFVSSASVAQDFKVSLRPKQIAKIDKVDNVGKKLRLYKRYYKKDSTQARKAERKYWKDRLDSMIRSERRASILPADKIEGLAQTHSGADGFKLNEKIPSGSEGVSASSPLGLADVPLDIPVVPINKEVQTLSLPGLPAKGVPATVDSVELKAKARQKAEELAMKYVEENAAQLQAIQQKVSVLMNKYRVVPNSNDLSTAIKRTSLKGIPFRRRWYLSGNLQFVQWNPFTFDLSPAVGYRFNMDFVAGVGCLYRKSFTDSTRGVDPDLFGYKVFACHEMFRSFFLYWEAATSKSVNKRNDVVMAEWQHALFLGIGRKLPLTRKLDTTIVFLYDFLHKKNDLYPRALSIRIGFQPNFIPRQ